MSATFKPVRPLGDFLRVLIAPTIWFAHFSFLYAAETLICIGPPAGQNTTMRWTAVLATAAALTGLVILVVGLVRPGNTSQPPSDEGKSWLLRASLMTALLSVLGIFWTTLPTTILSACAADDVGAIHRNR